MNRNKYSDIIYMWEKHVQLSSLLNSKYKGEKHRILNESNTRA